MLFRSLMSLVSGVLALVDSTFVGLVSIAWGSTDSSLVGLASAGLAEILVMFVFECFGLFDIWLLSLRWYRLFVHPMLS